MDAAFVKALRKAFEADGLSVWIDESSIPAGVPFLATIYGGIEGTSTFVAVLTPHLVDSRFCRLEPEHAILHAKRIVTIHRGHVNPQDLHPALAEVNWIEFPAEREFEDGIQACIGAV